MFGRHKKSKADKVITDDQRESDIECCSEETREALELSQEIIKEELVRATERISEVTRKEAVEREAIKATENILLEEIKRGKEATSSRANIYFCNREKKIAEAEDRLDKALKQGDSSQVKELFESLLKDG